MEDGICAVAGEREAGITSQWVKSTKSKAGFVVNEAKSTWAPAQKLQWLGFTIDLEHGQVSIPDKKLTNLRRLLKDACMQDYADARHIAGLIGNIISMGLALGPIARFMTRAVVCYAMHGVRFSVYQQMQKNGANLLEVSSP